MYNFFRLSSMALFIFVATIELYPVKAGSYNDSTLNKSFLTIKTSDNTHRFLIETARTDIQQRQGLMFRRHLALNAGMLFTYRAPQILTMWMKNTYLPLDMLFVAADGRIVKIVQRTVPQSLEIISSGELAIAVLELNGGTTSRLKIKKGDWVNHPAFGLSKH